MTANTPDPVTLEGDVVRLEPLSLTHIPDLFLAAAATTRCGAGCRRRRRTARPN
ncbi:hypothetical protein ACFQX6_56115 [Streptosporangium lutulentum]